MNQTEYQKHALQFTHGFAERIENGVRLFSAHNLNKYAEITHGFTGREGGVSKGAFESLNLTFEKTDDEQNVLENFNRFSKAAHIPYSNMCIINFEHGANVAVVTKKDCGKGLAKPPLPHCDALVTNEANVALITSHADCGCFFVYDNANKAVGIAHAGWKGVLYRIGANIVENMIREYGSNPGDLIVSTGPSICKNCYEVDLALAHKFENEFGLLCHDETQNPEKALLNLDIPSAVQFLDCGVLAKNINLFGLCTYENPKTFFSYRYNRAPTGDMAGYIMLK